MKISAWIASGIFLASSLNGAAGEWVALDGDPSRGELEVSSIKKQGKSGFANIRFVIVQDGITYFVHQSIAMSCGSAEMKIVDGHMKSDRSSKVVKMPHLPESDRIIYIPSPNQAFNRLYDFVCQYE